MDELKLSECCKLGDNNARKKLYETYGGRLFTLLYRYTANREIAEDLLHDSFIKIFSSIDKFAYRGEGSLRAWLERVTVNIALEYLRKNNNNDPVISIEEMLELSDQPEPEDIEMIPKDILMKFISELPDGYRTVFNLYTFEEKSHKEIALMLGINEKSSSSQLSRAKALLTIKIKEYVKG